MTEVELPFIDTEIDTDDATGSAMNLLLAAVGVAGTFGVVAAGQYLYNQARGTAGVGADNDPIPGV